MSENEFKNENKDIEEYSNRVPAMPATVDAIRVQKETEGAIIIAKKFPRDKERAFSAIMSECEQPILAKKAIYSYPRGTNEDGTKNMVSGPSVRLAEVFARNYGNMAYGTRVLLQEDTVSHMEAYCWDMENNTRASIIFDVPHVRDTKKKKIILTDARDIYEVTANMGSRRLRACILRQIPVDIVEQAIAKCKKAAANELGKNIEASRRELVAGFTKFGITMEMIEKRLSHKITEMSMEEAVEYLGILNSLVDKTHKREDFFEFTQEPTQDDETEDLNNKLKGGDAEARKKNA